ncbi:hypothetical protein JR065_03655 [Xanthomonas sp. AmX2]|uniref:hypothetical protein n=1 Tax=Xanthomonas sp. TaxID=29446 RepID=UPI0019817658|nr:hypothetical protein [Xanthomonas sp.]MBN6149422.1 hypothetical protein [Xanthomonas sp.]
MPSAADAAARLKLARPQPISRRPFQEIALMEQNPYSAPATGLQAAPAAPLGKAPDDVLRRIKVGWIVAALQAAIILFGGLVALKNGNTVGGWASAVEAMFIAALAYGVWRKHRVAASALLAYYVLARIALLFTGHLDGAVLGVIMILVYLSAARGTFQYHRWLQQERRFPSSQRPRLSDDPLFRTPSAAAVRPTQDQTVSPPP